ncbi:hypothetical protein GCK72_021410 [Caenorhabditis remanei]|uniref:F-box domain-containing protein n=1 Tax=Caenorhabditis remanei TaxID=31234 RepID=A0A6A5GJW6_CAERE|nr:hypothetical protein GCK72_021410 [Caenorhabditis remanei]KAF1754845.1 hypothetical protein GCK72_021410 [Caenorhabditis remanei]
MTDESPFLKLPEIVMDNVLHYCDYLEIARLRKTCRSLRNYVDSTTSDALMTSVEITAHSQEVRFLLRSRSCRIDAHYSQSKDGYSMQYYTNGKCEFKTKKIHGENYLEAFKKDLEIFMKYQKGVISHLRIDLPPPLSEGILKVIENRGSTLKVTEIYVFNLPATQLLSTISLIDAQCLENLKVFTKEQRDVIDEIMDLEQWKHLYYCQLLNFQISQPRRISHIGMFTGNVTSVTAADLDFLKTAFLNSSMFCCCKMNCNSIADLSEIAEIFGVQPFTSRGSTGGVLRLWFFRMPNDKTTVLSLDVNSFHFVEFRHKKTAEVPSDAVIIG